MVNTKVLDRGYVNEVLFWGSDEDIIRAARMSTDGAFRGWGPVHAPWCQQHPEYHHEAGCEPKPGDEKLLRYLWEHKHNSPFEFAGLSVEIQAPIFVAREIMRHRTMSFNELSARYTELPDLYYIPSIERLMSGVQSVNRKQGSTPGFTADKAQLFQNEMAILTGVVRKIYEDFLQKDMSRELARVITPVNQYTRFRMQGNLRNWLGFLELRLGEGVQWETLEYAKAVATLLEPRFPRSFALFRVGLDAKRD